MKKKLIFLTLIVLFSALGIKCADDQFGDLSDFVGKYYKKYRLLSNQVLTFDYKDEIDEDDALKLKIYYKAYYNDDKKIMVVETYIKGQITKRQRFDTLGNVIRLETFRNGKLIGYYVNYYDEDNKQLLVKRELLGKDDQLKQVMLFFFGRLEGIDYYNSEGHLFKSETYLGNKVDVTKVYDATGNVIEERGKYDNGRYPYSLKYFYNSNSLIKVESRQKNKLVKIHFYNKNGINYKEESYNSSEDLIQTVHFDAEGNPIKK